MTWFPLAFLLGLFGSIHCAVMCGPLMLGLTGKSRSITHAVGQSLLYQGGRIVTYAALGGLTGLLGGTIRLFADQQTLSIAIGVLMLTFAVLHFRSGSARLTFGIPSYFSAGISRAMTYLAKLPFWGFFAGLLNGLIPCGMVYLALTSSLNTGTSIDSIKFMILFGLGTTPLMLIVSAGGIFVRRYVIFNTSKFFPWVTLLIGVVFILRAAELDIPYLSPAHSLHFQGKSAECR